MATSSAQQALRCKTTGSGETDDTDHTEKKTSKSTKEEVGKRACSDTIEESSSVDEVDARRKCPRYYKESPCFRLRHFQPDTSLHSTSPLSERTLCVPTRCGTKSALPFISPSPTASSHDLCQSSPALAPLNDFALGGYAGVRLEEARNQDQPRTKGEERTARQRRINEAGDSVPGSQDSLARQVRNLQLSDTSAPSPMPHSRRPPQARPRQQPQEYRRSAQCGPDPSACRGASDHGFMPHMVQKHGGQRLIQENVTQLRHLDQSACVACVSFQVATMSPLQLLQKRYSTPRLYYWRHLSGPSTIRTPGCRARQLAHRSPASSQPAPPGDSLDDTPLPSCPIRDIVLIERDKQLLAELRRASAMALPRCTVSRYATAWTESLEGAISGHQSWAVLCRYRCRLLLAEVTKDTDRNAELKLRLQLWEVGEVS